MHCLKRYILGSLILFTIFLKSPPILADELHIKLATNFEMLRWLRRQPLAIRQEFARRISIIGSFGTIALIASDKVWTDEILEGLGRKVFVGALRVGYFMGAMIVIDGVVGYVSGGRFFPVMQSVDELMNLVKPAHAATWGDYYLSSREAFESFLQLPEDRAVQVLEMNPELARIVVAWGEICKARTAQPNYD